MSEPTREVLQEAIVAAEQTLALSGPMGCAERRAQDAAEFDLPVYRLALEALDKREQRCETCSHWIDRGESQYCRTLATIVPMRVYGQPFGCTAHTPKEPQS